MASPICTVNGQSTTNGYDCATGDTITIALVDDTDVVNWSLTCFATDDFQNAATITLALVIDNPSKTATLTMPSTARGCALLFKSIVNNSYDTTGTYQSSYTTTFGVFARGYAGMRLISSNQITEGDSVNGWITDVNRILAGELPRNPNLGDADINITGAINAGSISIANGFDITGRLIANVHTIIPTGSGNYYCDSTQKDFIIFIDAQIGLVSYLIYLPEPTNGRMITIINCLYNCTLSIRPYSSELIHYHTSYNIYLWNGETFISDGVDWFVTSPRGT